MGRVAGENPAAELELIGHRWAANLLQNCIDTGKVSHAYLITGPAGVGKYRLALNFTLALSCENPPEEGVLRFCGECRSCRLISMDRHPDVTCIGLEWQSRQEGVREGNAGQNLKIDTIRAIGPEINRPPKEIPWRIFIIRDAETMQATAANAFLKTLEEPPPRIILILISDSDRPMLPTIVSRCQVLELRPVPQFEIEQALAEKGAPEKIAHTLAALAAGRPGWAVNAVQDTTRQKINDRDEALMFLEQMLPANRAERLAFVEDLAQKWQSGGNKRASVLTLINIWLGWWRDLALTRQDLSHFATNADRQDELKQQASSYTPIQIKEMLQGLTRAQAELESNVAPRLALGDLLLNKLPRPAKN